jgi:hypothetical protein
MEFQMLNPHSFPYYFFFFNFWWDCSLNSGFCTCKEGILWLELHLQSLVILEMWSHELFAWVCLKSQSSQSQSLK